jgi:hypothetical protein
MKEYKITEHLLRNLLILINNGTYNLPYAQVKQIESELSKLEEIKKDIEA